MGRAVSIEDGDLGGLLTHWEVSETPFPLQLKLQKALSYMDCKAGCCWASASTVWSKIV